MAHQSVVAEADFCTIDHVDLTGDSNDDSSDHHDPSPAATEDVDLGQLYAEAVATTWSTVRQAEVARDEELRDLGQKLRAEQDKLYGIVMAALPGAVREAAAKGQRTAVLLRFSGADKLEEFCYLYMLKGPHNPEHRAEMRAMGAKPLLHRLRSELQRAGFGVHHAWQRATNDNTLSVSW